MSDDSDSAKLDAAVMDPEASPQRPGRGVRRVNNLPIAILGGAVAVFLTVIAYVASGRASSAQSEASAEQLTSARSVAAEITRPYEAGQVPAAGTQAPSPQPGAAEQQQPAEPAAQPPLPPGFPAPPPPPGGEGAQLSPPLSSRPAQASAGGPGLGPAAAVEAEDPERAELSRMRLQMFKGALRSETTVDSTAAPATTAASARPSARGSHLTAAGQGGYIERLKQLQEAGLLPDAEPQAAGGRQSYAQFEGSGGEDRWSNPARMQAPGSPYELRAGAVLPATLITGINSDLPGQITALVAQDVRDTATGEHILIPQASRLIGTYGSDIKFGQERVLVAWQRIVFPDGKALDIGAMPGADSAGYAGFADQVDNHYLRLFASAVLMSGITAGITISQDSFRDEDGRITMSGAMTEALGQQLGQVSEELIRRQMNVAPTIEIRPGYRFNVQVTKDLTFSGPYRAYDYDRSIRLSSGRVVR